MEKFTNVMSSADKVEALEITEETVIVRSGITHDEKDEYIKLMAEKNDSLDQQATDLQLALAEVYEQIIS